MLLLLLLFGFEEISTQASCPWELENLSPWSDPATWDQGLPADGNIVELRKPVLLDTETTRLHTLIIRDGGMLVFSPNVPLAKLTVGVVKVQENGSLLIGASDCRFPGQAEILLTGENGPDTSMGQYIKGLYVEVGGTLDIHGEEKLPWTHLISTLQPQSGYF